MNFIIIFMTYLSLVNQLSFKFMKKSLKNYSCIILLLTGIFNAENVCSSDDEDLSLEDLYFDQTLQIQQGHNKPFDMRLYYEIHAADDSFNLVAHGGPSSTCLYYRFINDKKTHTPQAHTFYRPNKNDGFFKGKKTAEETERKSLSNLPVRVESHDDSLCDDHLSDETKDLSPAPNKLSIDQLKTIAQMAANTIAKTVRQNRNLPQKALRAKAAESVKNLSLIKID